MYKNWEEINVGLIKIKLEIQGHTIIFARLEDCLVADCRKLDVFLWTYKEGILKIHTVRQKKTVLIINSIEKRNRLSNNGWEILQEKTKSVFASQKRPVWQVLLA